MSESDRMNDVVAIKNVSGEADKFPKPIYGEYIHKGDAVCPECGCDFEIKEFKPMIMSFSDEGIKIQKAIDSVNIRRKINNAILTILAFMLLMFFILVDENQLSEKLTVIAWIIWITNCLIRILGVYYLCRLEIKGFEKLMKKHYPMAYNF